MEENVEKYVFFLISRFLEIFPLTGNYAFFSGNFLLFCA